MSQHTILVRDEQGQAVKAHLYYLDATGAVLGEYFMSGDDIHVVDDSEIPEGTVGFKFEADGYNWYGTATLYDSNTITLIKKTNPIGYLLLGAAGLWLLSKFVKF